MLAARSDPDSRQQFGPLAEAVRRLEAGPVACRLLGPADFQRDVSFGGAVDSL